MFLKNLIVALIFLSLCDDAIWYSPFSNLPNTLLGTLLIGFTKSGFNSKFATPNAVGCPLINLKLAGRKSFNLSVASIYSCVVLSFGV